MRIEADEAAPYDVTEADRLWLLRAVHAEGPPHAEVAQTLLNGFMAARARGYSGTLTQYVRAYAQPVNPKWFEGGELFERSIAQATTEDVKKSRRDAARARQYVHSVRTTFSPAAVAAVQGALTAGPRLPAATDYAASWVVRSPPWVAITPEIKGENRFWARPNALGWSGYRVAGAVVGGIVVSALLFAAAAYAVSRS